MSKSQNTDYALSDSEKFANEEVQIHHQVRGGEEDIGVSLPLLKLAARDTNIVQVFEKYKHRVKLTAEYPDGRHEYTLHVREIRHERTWFGRKTKTQLLDWTIFHWSWDFIEVYMRLVKWLQNEHTTDVTVISRRMSPSTDVEGPPPPSYDDVFPR